MAVSVFDMFTVGIGPSSSHTVGPMRAGVGFLENLQADGLLDQVHRVRIKLFGSLGATGRGHGTDRAVLAGLAGEHPDTVDPELPARLMARAAADHTLTLASTSESAARTIVFNPITDLVMEGRRRLRFHPNALSLTAYRDDDATPELHNEVWYSIGGGFVVRDDGTGEPPMPRDETRVPHPFRNGAELLNICAASGMSIPQVVLANEMAHGYSKDEVREKLMGLWTVMDQSITDGCGATGELPGGLGVRRRAHKLHSDLMNRRQTGYDPLAGLDWVSAWAIAVNEQNAVGGRVVTAPTNGAAGIVPAVLKHVLTFASPDGLRDDERLVANFLLTAGAIGMVFQQTASISGAEVGCQGEVGVACSMAAASLAQVAGGTPQQVCNAAEIGMEHHLGLTCDPVRGLVQVPCIERNAVGAVTAITAARLALAGDGRQLVSLDEVCATMMSTGADMKDKYKETSRGGLAVNLANC
ncbi:L-serine ammonia-lyase [Propionibacterium freudenreichii]|uniref:L-serine ammonia-lyase n=1 Tax=Propionibacterium freudenreichii TaxID=1744 RepID=UPI000BEF109F|nr:L-serine ammonia-lyase [Propionibacterium freudenreichii]WFF34689.1 L-serine ammonia-lyase [Propionibacterium freudenreichii]WFF36918.1 L-serine ammonia-lyase [Propionibacterium freudenreichii]